MLLVRAVRALPADLFTMKMSQKAPGLSRTAFWLAFPGSDQYVPNGMKALVYRRSVPRYLLAGLASRAFPRRFFPALAPLRLEEIFVNTPAGWVLVRNRLCGICGSDLRLLRGEESFLMEPYAFFPFVLGHEIVAEVIAAAPDTDWKPGDRVTVEPFLGCAARGLPPCRSCARGDRHLCENLRAGEPYGGLGIGYTAGVGGGMAEQTYLPPANLVRIPDGLDDRVAVLCDPLASALHPLLNHFPADDQTVVVCGLGIIGQNLIRALRALGSRARLIGLARYGFQKELALQGGADEVLLHADRRMLAEALGARFLRTTLGGGNIEGGADIYFDCVGSARSLQDGLLALRARGRYVLIGSAGRTGPVDFSPLWFREVSLHGSGLPGPVEFRGNRVRPHELALKLLADEPTRWSGLEARVFPLSRYREAFQAAFNKQRFRAMKVALDPRG